MSKARIDTPIPRTPLQDLDLNADTHTQLQIVCPIPLGIVQTWQYLPPHHTPQ
jgi:hypothetical protein